MHYLNLLTLFAVGALAQSRNRGGNGGATGTEDGSDTTLVTSFTTSSSTSSTSRSSSSSGTQNIQLIYGLANTLNTYTASVIGADQASTTYVANCATGVLTCINDDFTVTSGSTSIHVTNSGVSIGITYAELFTCQVAGTTSVSCVYSLGASSGGQKTSTITTITESAATLPAATFLITAGQEKIAAASTVTPSNTGNAAVRATIMSPVAQKGLFMTMFGSAAAVLAFAILL